MALDRGDDDLVVLGFGELHAERCRERVRRHVADDRGVLAEQLLRSLVGLLLRLVVDLRDHGQTREDLVQPLLGVLSEPVLQVDDDLDAAGRVLHDQVDLAADQQRHPQQEQRDERRGDRGEHDEAVATQPRDGLAEVVVEAGH